MDGTYSTDEVCAITGITYRQADYWARTGAVEPLVGARGSGSRRRWTAHEVCAVQALAQLRALGAETTQMREAWSFLLDLPLEHWDTVAYVDALGRVGLHVPPAGWVLDLAACRETVAGARRPVAA
jgi:hypothetical protein